MLLALLGRVPCREPLPDSLRCLCVQVGVDKGGRVLRESNPFSGEGRQPQWPEGRARVAKGAIIKFPCPLEAPQSTSKDPSTPEVPVYNCLYQMVAHALKPLDGCHSSSLFSLSRSAGPYQTLPVSAPRLGRLFRMEHCLEAAENRSRTWTMALCLKRGMCV